MAWMMRATAASRLGSSMRSGRLGRRKTRAASLSEMPRMRSRRASRWLAVGGTPGDGSRNRQRRPSAEPDITVVKIALRPLHPVSATGPARGKERVHHGGTEGTERNEGGETSGGRRAVVI